MDLKMLDFELMFVFQVGALFPVILMPKIEASFDTISARKMDQKCQKSYPHFWVLSIVELRSLCFNQKNSTYTTKNHSKSKELYRSLMV